MPLASQVSRLRRTAKSSRTTDQSSQTTIWSPEETVLDNKLGSMNEDVNEMEPGCEIAPAETDEKEVSVISDRKAVSSDGKDDLVSQLPQDFIGPTAKKIELHIPEEYQLKMKNGGFRHGVKPQGPLSKRRLLSTNRRFKNVCEEDQWKQIESPTFQAKRLRNRDDD